MGRHAGRRGWFDLAPQEKADDFDAQYAESAERAERQREEHRGAYYYDHMVTGDSADGPRSS